MSPWRRLGRRAALCLILLLLHEVGARLLGAHDPIALGLAAAQGSGAALRLAGLGGGVALLLALRLFLYVCVPPWLALAVLRALTRGGRGRT